MLRLAKVKQFALPTVAVALSALSFNASSSTTTPDFSRVTDAIQSFVSDRSPSNVIGPAVTLRKYNPVLSNCNNIQVSSHNGKALKIGNNLITINCDGKDYYMMASISGNLQYVSLKEDAPAGTLIQAYMLQPSVGEFKETPRGIIANPNDIIGTRTLRTIKADSVILDYQIKRPNLVERGSKVTYYSSGQGFEISRDGEALQAGSAGDVISVRFSNRLVKKGTIQPDGRISK